MMTDILVIGAGGHGQVVADILSMNPSHNILGFLDDDESLKGTHILDYTVLGLIDDLSNIKHDAVIIAIGNNKIRKQIAERIKRITRFCNAIHPSAIIAKDVIIGTGIVICAGAVVNPGSLVGNHVILNTCSSVDHHNILQKYIHIAPGAHSGGNVKMNEGTFVGIGASIVPGISIGQWVVVGAGSVALNNVDDFQVVVGNPARVIRDLRK